MKNLSFKLLTATVAGLLGFWSCNTEEVEPNVPQISVQEGNLVYVDALEGEFTLNVNTNRDWQVIIPDGVEWLIVDPSQTGGTGNAAIVFYYGSNTGITHEVTVRIATATTWIDVRVVQRGATPSTVLLYENMGNTNVSANTNISELPESFKWLRDGMGASDVTYAGTNSSLRTTYSAAGLYLGASGGNNCFFGSGANFTISHIRILDNPVVKVTFGCSKSGSDYGYVPVGQDEIQVQYSFDAGATWNDAGRFTRTSYNGWGVATLDDIVVTGGAATIDLRFAAQAASVIRLDDVTVTGIGGDEIATPVVTTYASTANTPTTADVGAHYAYQQPTPRIVEFGIEWRLTSETDYPAANRKTSFSASINDYTTTIDPLETGVNYTYRGYVITEDGQTCTGNEMTVTPQYPAVYYENCGSDPGMSASATIAANNWLKGGSGGANASYTGTPYESGSGVDVRGSSPSSYTGASGTNNIFFQPAEDGSTWFQVGNIDLSALTAAGHTGFDFSYGVTTNNDTSVPLTWFSTDGGINWSPMKMSAYTGSSSWQNVSTQIVVPAAATTLMFKFTGVYSLSGGSKYTFGTRLDDLKLVRNDEAVATPVLVTGKVGETTASTAVIGGNMYYHPDLSGDVGVAYRKQGAAAWSLQPLSGAKTSPYGIDLTGLDEMTTYEYAAYAVDGTNLGDIKTLTTPADPAKRIWIEHIGGAAQSVSGNTNVSAYPDANWTRGGYDDRQTGVKYTGASYASALQVRGSRASDTYTDASGYNNIFFGSGGGGGMTFTAEDIALWGQTGVKLVFGSYSYTADYSTDELKVEYRLGGGDWTPLTYTRASDMRMWGTAISATIPTTGKSSIALRWTNITTNEYRIDDMMLLQDGTIVPLPNPPTAMTTTAASAIGRTKATIGGNYTEGAGNAATRAGIEYRASGGVDAWTKVPAAAVATSFSVTLTGLTAATAYEYRMYVTTAADTYVDSTAPVRTFTTDAASTLVYNDPTVSGTLTVGTASTASLLIGYTGAVGGEEVDVSVAVSGAGAAGLTTPVTYTGTLAAGAGTIAVPVRNGASDWTPSAVGDAVFTPAVTTTYKTDPAVTAPALTSAIATVAAAGGPAAPDDLAVPAATVTRTSAAVDFTAAPGANSTEVSYKKTADATWTVIDPATTGLTLQSLSPGTQYDVRARSNDTGTYSPYTATVNFTTLADLAFGQAAITNGNFKQGEAVAGTLTIPYTGALASDRVSLTLTPSGGFGLSVYSMPVPVTLTAGEHNLTVDLSDAAWSPNASGTLTITLTGTANDAALPAAFTDDTLNVLTEDVVSASATEFTATWNFSAITGASDGNAKKNPTQNGVVAPAASTVSSALHGDYLSDNGGLAKCWGCSGLHSTAIPGNNDEALYATVTVQSSSSTKKVSLSELSMNIRRSGTGPATSKVYYQIGSGAFALLGTYDHSAVTTAAGNPVTVDLSAVAALQNVVGQTITIKLVPLGASGSSGTWYFNSSMTSGSATALSIAGTEE